MAWKNPLIKHAARVFHTDYENGRHEMKYEPTNGVKETAPPLSQPGRGWGSWLVAKRGWLQLLM